MSQTIAANINSQEGNIDNNAGASAGAESNSSSSGGSSMTTIIIVLVVLGVFGAGAAYLFMNKKNKKLRAGSRLESVTTGLTEF